MVQFQIATCGFETPGTHMALESAQLIVPVGNGAHRRSLFQQRAGLCAAAPRPLQLCRMSYDNWSIVAELMSNSFFRTLTDGVIYPCFSSTATSAGRKGANRLEQIRQAASQAMTNAALASSPAPLLSSSNAASTSSAVSKVNALEENLS